MSASDIYDAVAARVAILNAGPDIPRAMVGKAREIVSSDDCDAVKASALLLLVEQVNKEIAALDPFSGNGVSPLPGEAQPITIRISSDNDSASELSVANCGDEVTVGIWNEFSQRMDMALIRVASVSLAGVGSDLVVECDVLRAW